MGVPGKHVLGGDAVLIIELVDAMPNRVALPSVDDEGLGNPTFALAVGRARHEGQTLDMSDI